MRWLTRSTAEEARPRIDLCFQCRGRALARPWLCEGYSVPLGCAAWDWSISPAAILRSVGWRDLEAADGRSPTGTDAALMRSAKG